MTKNIDVTTLGGRIKALRKAKNLSQEELAFELSYENKSDISRLESGRRMPSPDMIIAIANYFGTTTDYLLMGEVRDNKSLKLLQAETLLQSLQDEKTLDAAISMLSALRMMELN